MQLTIPQLTTEPWTLTELELPIPGASVRAFRVASDRREYVVFVAGDPRDDSCGCRGGDCEHRRLVRRVVGAG